MNTVKIKMTDGSVQTIQGDIEKVTVRDLETGKSMDIKLVDINEQDEVYELYNEGGPLLRPRRPR